jgi:hypothetical protein
MSPKQIRSIHRCVVEKSHQLIKSEVMHTLEKATLSAADFRVCKGQKQARECLASINAGERYSGS